MNLPTWEIVYENVNLGDKRRNKRIIETANQIEHMTGLKGASATLRSHSELKAVSRIMNSRDITPENITEGFINNTCGAISAKHVLVVEDTTELNFAWRKKILKFLGPTGNGKDQGFFLHPAIVVEPACKKLLGLAALSMHTREFGIKTTAGEAYKYKHIEDKESYRWISVPRKGCKQIPEDTIKTIVADREADIYELFYEHYTGNLSENCELLIRAAHNRTINDGETHLFDKILSWEVAGSHNILIEGTKKRKSRVASCSIRFGEVTLDIPTKNRRKKERSNIPGIYVVDIREDNPSDNEDGIHWTLLTTWKVKTLDEAVEKIEWYRCRWVIEELFRILKSGYQTETVRFDDGHALMNWCALRLMMAMKVLYLQTNRNDETERSAENVFTQEEIEVLAACENDLISVRSTIYRPQGKTIAWASLIVALLGGYKAIPSAKPFGQISLWRGLSRLEGAVIGYRAAMKNVGRS